MEKSIVSLGELERYAEALVRMYIECFAEEPWFEIFTEEEVGEWLNEVINYERSLFLLCSNRNCALGALFAFPLKYKPDVADFIPAIIPSQTIYIAEVFVDKRYRNKGVATALQDECLARARDMGFEHAVLRTNFNSKMHPLIQKSEFSTVARQTVFSKKFIGGKLAEIPDERGIFLKKL